jgi:hypothetical protein
MTRPSPPGERRPFHHPAALDAGGSGTRRLRAQGQHLQPHHPQGKSAVHLQRSRYGWDAQIVLRFVTPEGDASNHPDWPEDEDLTLWHFASDLSTEPGTLAFVDVLENPETLAAAIDLLATRALPWLDALHDG